MVGGIPSDILVWSERLSFHLVKAVQSCNRIRRPRRAVLIGNWSMVSVTSLIFYMSPAVRPSFADKIVASDAVSGSKADYTPTDPVRKSSLAVAI